MGSQFCQIQNIYSRNGQKLFKILPKWRNFANLVPLFIGKVRAVVVAQLLERLLLTPKIGGH